MIDVRHGPVIKEFNILLMGFEDISNLHLIRPRYLGMIRTSNEPTLECFNKTKHEVFAEFLMDEHVIEWRFYPNENLSANNMSNLKKGLKMEMIDLRHSRCYWQSSRRIQGGLLKSAIELIGVIQSFEDPIKVRIMVNQVQDIVNGAFNLIFSLSCFLSDVTHTKCSIFHFLHLSLL